MERSRRGDVRIDFESLAAFLLEPEVQARNRGLGVARIIVAPEYVPLLLGTPSGRRLGSLEDALVRGAVWVRHDEHFHVDFEAMPGQGTVPEARD